MSDLMCPVLAMGMVGETAIITIANGRVDSVEQEERADAVFAIAKCRRERCAWWCDHDGDGMCSMLHSATVHSGYIEALGDEVNRVGLAIGKLTKAVEKAAKKEPADG